MTWAIEEKSYSQRRACSLVGLHPKTYRYASTRPDDLALRAKLKALEDENRRLKKLLAESMLDAATLKEMLGKNF